MRFSKSSAKKASSSAAAPAEDAPAADAAEDAVSRDKLLMADIALQGGTYLLRRGIEQGMLGRELPHGKKLRKAKGLGLGGSLVHGAILRLATRSVPGAILVGGGLLAKTLHDRRKAARIREQSAAQAHDGEEEGEEA